MHDIHIRTKSQTDLVDITSEVQRVVRDAGVESGLCLVYVPHTTAGLVVNENWDPSVRQDIIHALTKLVPTQGVYQHAEGNAAAHIKACLIGTSEVLPIENGQIRLGRWQGVFFAEFDGPRSRTIWVQIR